MAKKPLCNLGRTAAIPMKSTKLIIVNKLGLHARAARKVVQLASQYHCESWILANGRKANAKRIMEVMLLAVSKDSEIEICVAGNGEAELIGKLQELVQNRFDEEE